ncbi:hypothetical protein FOCC_FOCC004000 [Frankliniella occidentalis]|nr:hypothetical protein FOCC_FOCC004000 [Frankliniella occidentalis]
MEAAKYYPQIIRRRYGLSKFFREIFSVRLVRLVRESFCSGLWLRDIKLKPTGYTETLFLFHLPVCSVCLHEQQGECVNSMHTGTTAAAGADDDAVEWTPPAGTMAKQNVISERILPTWSQNADYPIIRIVASGPHSLVFEVERSLRLAKKSQVVFHVRVVVLSLLMIKNEEKESGRRALRPGDKEEFPRKAAILPYDPLNKQDQLYVVDLEFYDKPKKKSPP